MTSLHSVSLCGLSYLRRIWDLRCMMSCLTSSRWISSLCFNTHNSSLFYDGPYLSSNSCLQLAERVLYHWKTFPFILPSSITDSQRAENIREGGISSVSFCAPFNIACILSLVQTSEYTFQEGVISFKDLFNAPTFDELEEVARDSKGSVKKLSDKQLADIRQMGWVWRPTLLSYQLESVLCIC